MLMNEQRIFQKIFGILKTCKKIGSPTKLVSTWFSSYYSSLFMPFPLRPRLLPLILDSWCIMITWSLNYCTIFLPYSDPPFTFPVLNTCVRSCGLQLLGHPIQSWSTESSFRETSCGSSHWKANSHRFLDFSFKNSTGNSEKSISAIWGSAYCERKAENSLGLKPFFMYWVLSFPKCSHWFFFLLCNHDYEGQSRARHIFGHLT